jgi:hypothetical protein
MLLPYAVSVPTHYLVTLNKTGVSVNAVSVYVGMIMKSVESLIHRVAQNSVNSKYYLVLTGMFRFKPASESAEQYHSVVSSALNTEDLI